VSRGAPAPLLVATDLDGCLLDPVRYTWAPAAPALRALAARGGRLVLASSKTRAEMEPLARQLPLLPSLIVENGGALLAARAQVPAAADDACEDGPWWRLARPADRAFLVTALAEIAAEAGARVRGFAAMDAAEVALRSGLAPEAAALALRREYDEPFVLEAGDAGRLEEAARRKGLRLLRGGRFHHLTGAADKGTALLRLLELMAAAGERPRTMGLGDAPNDLPLLRVVDRPVLVPGPDGQVAADLRAAFPTARRAPRPGPEGWNRAVLDALGEAEAAVEAEGR
jgi:mannosyl-3-phosphoglycerate phosphatase